MHWKERKRFQVAGRDHGVRAEGHLALASLLTCCSAIYLSAGGQSELESTLNLNAMNQSPNPWHVSFSYARALQVRCEGWWYWCRCGVDGQVVPALVAPGLWALALTA